MIPSLLIRLVPCPEADEAIIATAAFRWLRDRYLIVTAVSGVVLVTMGVLLFTGELTQLNIQAQQALNDLHLNVFKDL